MLTVRTEEVGCEPRQAAACGRRERPRFTASKGMVTLALQPQT